MTSNVASNINIAKIISTVRTNGRGFMSFIFDLKSEDVNQGSVPLQTSSKHSHPDIESPIRKSNGPKGSETGDTLSTLPVPFKVPLQVLLHDLHEHISPKPGMAPPSSIDRCQQ